MNTWKDNNIQTHAKDSHFLEAADSGEDLELPPDAKLVGGVIFYIDDTADGTYEFFDTNGTPIERVQAGDRPYAYRVVKKSSGDKYYVYHDEVYDKLRWTFYRNNAFVYESLDTAVSVESGKTNTKRVVEKNNGEYAAADSKGRPTIWHRLQQVRSTKVGGCDDWFIPSKNEIEELRKAIVSGSIKGGVIAGSSYDESVFMSKFLWSSSEYFSQLRGDSSQGACIWLFGGVPTWGYGDKSGDVSVFFARSF